MNNTNSVSHILVRLSVDRDDPTPLYFQLKRQIHGLIRDGTAGPDAPIPTEFELADHCHVSRTVSRQALSELAKEGMVKRIRGKGTFVDNRQASNALRMVKILMPTTGHLFDKFSRLLVEQLQEIDHYCQFLNTAAERQSPEDLRRIVKRFLDAGPGLVVVDGIPEFPFDLLEERRNRLQRLFFIHRMETQLEFPRAMRVLSNYEEGGYLAIAHLLQAGHRRIAILFDYAWYFGIAVVQRILMGCRRACAEKELDPSRILVEAVAERAGGQRDMLVERLSKPDRPTAVFAIGGDFRAEPVYAAAKVLGLAIPHDLAIIGYNNTPWCYEYDVPLTSVSIEPAKMTEELASIISGEHAVADGETVLIKPKLIVRQSTGGGCAAKETMEKEIANHAS